MRVAGRVPDERQGADSTVGNELSVLQVVFLADDKKADSTVDDALFCVLRFNSG